MIRNSLVSRRSENNVRKLKKYKFTLFVVSKIRKSEVRKSGDRCKCVGFDVLTAVSTKMAVFWVVAPCSLVELHGATSQKTAIFQV
jgi:hypothetical protein